MKTYCLFIRAFILINCDKHEDIESTYMMMITEAEFPIKGLTLKACFAENQRVRWVVQWSSDTMEMQRILALGRVVESN